MRIDEETLCRWTQTVLLVIAFAFILMVLLSCTTRPPPLFPKEQLKRIGEIIEKGA